MHVVKLNQCEWPVKVAMVPLKKGWKMALYCIMPGFEFEVRRVLNVNRVIEFTRKT